MLNRLNVCGLGDLQYLLYKSSADGELGHTWIVLLNVTLLLDRLDERRRSILSPLLSNETTIMGSTGVMMPLRLLALPLLLLLLVSMLWLSQ